MEKNEELESFITTIKGFSRKIYSDRKRLMVPVAASATGFLFYVNDFSTGYAKNYYLIIIFCISYLIYMLDTNHKN
jgi:hypothetical protein